MKVDFDAVYCGSLNRHQQTLDGILAGKGASHTPSIEDALNEFEFMAVIKAYLVAHKLPFPDRQTPRSDYYRLLKQAMLSWQSGELDYLQLTESWSSFLSRTTGVLHAIASEQPKHALVVTSGGVLGAVLKSILSAPDETAVDLNLQIRNASVTQLFVGRSGVSLSEFNNVACFQTEHTQHLVTYS